MDAVSETANHQDTKYTPHPPTHAPTTTQNTPPPQTPTGGYVFIINIIPIHVLALTVGGRFSNRLYIAYSTFYVLGSIMAMQVRT